MSIFPDESKPSKRKSVKVTVDDFNILWNKMTGEEKVEYAEAYFDGRGEKYLEDIKTKYND